MVSTGMLADEQSQTEHKEKRKLIGLR